MNIAKVCLLGRFAVGKTSLLDRFVNNSFSSKYQTTVGVSISTKEMGSFKMIIWDIAGFEHDQHYLPYLRGIQGAMWVVDSTEPESVLIIQDIINSSPDLLKVPSVCLINKTDLSDQQHLTDADISTLNSHFKHIIYTSAKTGDHVNEAFELMKSQLQNQTTHARSG